jgi:hypothetical protein
MPDVSMDAIKDEVLIPMWLETLSDEALLKRAKLIENELRLRGFTDEQLELIAASTP